MSKPTRKPALGERADQRRAIRLTHGFAAPHPPPLAELDQGKHSFLGEKVFFSPQGEAVPPLTCLQFTVCVNSNFDSCICPHPEAQVLLVVPLFSEFSTFILVIILHLVIILVIILHV